MTALLSTTENFNKGRGSWDWAKRMLKLQKVLAHKDWYTKGYVIKEGTLFNWEIEGRLFLLEEYEADKRFGKLTSEWVILWPV